MAFHRWPSSQAPHAEPTAQMARFAGQLHLRSFLFLLLHACAVLDSDDECVDGSCATPLAHDLLAA